MRLCLSFVTLCLSGSPYFINAFQVLNRQAPQSFVYADSKTSSQAKKSGDDVVQQYAFPVGTFIEFEEKNREHIGKIAKLEHKISGGARYLVVDHEGKQYDIPDKAVRFAMHPPNSPAASDKLFEQFLAAHDATEESIQSKLQISPEILEIAWEESNETDDHLLTPSALVDLVHSHAASAIEKYMAWKLLRTEMAHIFFKEIKDHGRVVSFKAKARKAVEAAKETFCNSHNGNDLCLV